MYTFPSYFYANPSFTCTWDSLTHAMVEDHNNSASSEDCQRTDGTNTGRRSFLKQAGVVGTMATVGTVAGMSGVGAAYEETDYADRVPHDNVTTLNRDTLREKLGIAKATVLQGSFRNETGQYLHQIDTAAHSLYKRDYKNDDTGYQHQLVSSQKLEIENRNPNSSTLFVPDNPRDVGARPKVNNGENAGYGDAAFTAVVGALGLLFAPAGAISVASDVVNELRDHSKGGGQDSVTYSWDHGLNTGSPLDHFASFYIESNQMSAKYMTLDQFDSSVFRNPIKLGVVYTIGSQASSSSSENDGVVISQSEIPNGSVLADFANGGDLYRVPTSLTAGNTVETDNINDSIV